MTDTEAQEVIRLLTAWSEERVRWIALVERVRTLSETLTRDQPDPSNQE